ncbi:MAG: SLATT domain-containing protein [Sneathiella sp.]|nr:SLATT domain-containing protein [Sneathiella sp.]
MKLNSLIEWYRNQRPEHPRRMEAFRSKVEVLEWDKQNSKASLSVLFDAVNALAESEVRYYYRRRGSRALISGVARTLAWTLGAVGLLLPLLAGTGYPTLEDVGQFGYVFLAAAASCLAANSLFGGTEGHIRFVTTQLELEELITSARVGWCNYLVKPDETNQSHDDGFALIQSYASALHACTISETGRWGEATLKELAKFQKKMETKGKPPAKKNRSSKN